MKANFLSNLLLFSLLILIFFPFCGPKQSEVEKIFEDGVEIVINHLEPYKIKGESSALHFEKEFTIDSERDEIAKTGITDINGFDVDSGGNIYFFQV